MAPPEAKWRKIEYDESSDEKIEVDDSEEEIEIEDDGNSEERRQRELIVTITDIDHTDSEEEIEIEDDGNSEERWQRELIVTITDIDHTNSMHDRPISQLLDEPRRKPGYTLDFVTTDEDYEDTVSPILAAMDAECKDCLVKLIEAGANVNYLTPDSLTSKEGTTALYACHQVFDCNTRPDSNAFDFIQILLQHGADPNIRCHNESVVSTVHHPTIVQLLLDHGADISTPSRGRRFRHVLLSISDVWVSGIYPEYPESSIWPIGPCVAERINVLIDHSEKHNLPVPFDDIFQVASKVNDISSWECIQVVLRRGYLLDKSSKYARRLFTAAMMDNTVRGDKLGWMMIEQAPMMLQVCRNLLLGKTISPTFMELLANPPPLQSLCKGVVISAIGDRYLDKVRQLPLPEKTITFYFDPVKDTDRV